MKNGGIAIILMVALLGNAVARTAPARIVLPDGKELTGVFVGLENDTLHFTVGEGDSIKPLDLYKLDVKKVQLTEDSSLVDLTLSRYFVTSEKPVDTTIVIKPTLQAGSAVLKVVSFPPDARVYVDNILLDGLTPLVVPEIKGKIHTVMVRKFLKGVDWWGTVRVLAKEGDTARVNIKLLKPHTQLSVQSIPTEAEVYFDEQPSLSTMPSIWTDTTLVDVRPTLERSVTFFKVGYEDTTVTLPVEAFMPNLVGIEMHPITENLQKLHDQIEFVNKRKHKWVGRGLLWSSIAPFVAGTVLYVLGNQDWKKAADCKKSYEDAAFASSETDRLVRENKRLNNLGDTKATIAAGLGGAAIMLSSIGFALQF